MATLPKFLKEIDFEDATTISSKLFRESDAMKYRRSGKVRSYTAYPKNWGSPGLWNLKNGKLIRVRSLHAGLGTRRTYKGVDYSAAELVNLNRLARSRNDIVWTFLPEYKLGKRVMEKEGVNNYYYWPPPNQSQKIIQSVVSFIQSGIEYSTFGLVQPSGTPGLSY